MRCLIIEDDPFKLGKIEQFVLSNFSQFDIEKRTSFMSGVNETLQNSYDLILLDMSLPRYDDFNNSGNPKNFGGRDILKEMKRHKKKSKVIVITQYNEFDDGLISITELDSQLRSIYPEVYVGYIYYDEMQQNNWEQELNNYISKIIIDENTNS